MSSQRPPLTAGRLLVLVLGSPLLALYGVVTLVRGVLALGRRGHAARLALDTTLVCQNGHANETVGRWSCAACGSIYHGWVGRCAVCGAPAGRMDCAACGVGMPLPWSRR
jgi:predicted RNA-binding Zn-ribbon protein involved in translation (DUF1610 family)